MWHTQTEAMVRRKAEAGRKFSPLIASRHRLQLLIVIAPNVLLHNVDDTGERPYHQRTDGTAESSPERAVEGGWGERDRGGPVTHMMAMEDYEEMRRELSRLSQTRSKPRSMSRKRSMHSLALARTRSGRSAKTERLRPTRTDTRASYEFDEEEEQAEAAADAEAEDEKDEDFDLGPFLREGHFEKRKAGGESAKKVGVVYKHLTVKGVGATATFVPTLPQAVMGTFGPDLYHLITRFFPKVAVFGKRPPTRDLIHDFTGAVRDGEMMLVLGRPGSGCSTFLKAIANDRGSFAAVTGDVSYGGISADEQAKSFRGEVNYNPEDDQHLPNLTVWQTLKFSLMNKTKKHETDDIPVIINALLKMFGISHTKETQVGNEYVRGVSGGERKRVGIAETLSTKSTVVCWDSSTRGLDASTALDYANSLRVMTDISNRTTFVTLYQAGQGIYEQFDKVLLIEEGKMLYQGPAKAAKQYFEELGFHCPDRQTTADFLTSICDPNERQFRSGCEASTPKTPIELEQVFRRSEDYKTLLDDVRSYEGHLNQTDHADAREFAEAVGQGKSKHVSKHSSYTVSFQRHVLACALREFWLFWGDKTSLYTKFFIIISNGLIVGSLFHGEKLDTSGTFSRGGVGFFSILFLGWLQLSELMKAVSGRAIISRHRDYAFYRPSAVVIGRVLLDIPVVFAYVVLFGVVMYFMTGLDIEASKFFIYMLFVYTTTICVTALYRMFAALSPTIDDAVRFSGIALNLLIIYTGYVIPKPQLLGQYIWFGWLYYINPVAYSFESVLTNEFSGRTMQCSPSQLVPQGPGVDPRYQGCAITGAQLGQTTVTGNSYLATTYNYSRSHLWRNFGVVIAFTVLYILVTAYASEVFSFVGGGGGALVYKKTKKAKDLVKHGAQPGDEEKAVDTVNGPSGASSETATNEEPPMAISGSESIFTWENVEYTVPYGNGTRKLLNNVNGYAKPGVMIALMGASGAGKTTLLNTLAQRQKMGVVGGDMLVDGRPLGLEFQRGTGFCEQMDLHDATATIREALEFSAILRQGRDVPKQEKIAYVDQIIDLLELHDIEDALIASLGVEQRKRVTIGVELAAKPSLLLFLDEPTSGLDSQSAFEIIRFLKKLARAGQAIVCTIHQPSSILIQQFDMILALNPGGNTFYFGQVGENGSAVVKYFAERGVQCPPHKNVAEFILETAAKSAKAPNGRRINWNKEWLESAENTNLLKEIQHYKQERSQVPAPEAGTQHEFAAPILLQTTMLTKRLFAQYWRDPSYIYGKLFVSVIVGIFNGFTFWKLDDSLSSMQDRMFTLFLILLICPTILNGVLPKFFMNRALWEARELPSRIYGWFAFCTAQIITEIPAAVVGAILYWLFWYYPTGLPTDSSTAGYVFLMTLLFFLFQASWGQWICAFAPSFTVISNVLPFFLVMFSLFNGVVRPYSSLPVFWKYWMYYVNPSTYWIGGVLAATIRDTPVRCKPEEAAHFNPPPGQTCATYAAEFVKAAGQGYLTNPDATSDCGYCQYANGVEYMRTLNIKPEDKWRDFGIFLAFCFSNWALVYFLIYTVRIRGWSFGFGLLNKWFEKGVEAVAGLFKRKEKKSEEQSKA